MLKTFSLVFAGVAATLFFSLPISAQTDAVTRHAHAIKQEVITLGEGTRVSVELRDKREFIGRVNYIGDDFFVITEEKSQATQKLPYSDVDQILKKEKGFPKKGKIALGVIGVLFVMGLIANGGG